MMFHFIGSISPTPWANGIALMVMVYYTAKTSGAHLNPALTLAFSILGYTNPLEVIIYWVAQVSGCIVGALWMWLLIPPPLDNTPLITGCFVPSPLLSNAKIFAWEAFCTFSFLLPIFSVVWYTVHKQGYGNTGPLIVGLSLVANAFAAGPYTGAALNPARVLGSMAVFHCPSNHTAIYYILGEFLGAALVPVAIFPFYGINDEAWYLQAIPVKMNQLILGYQTNVRNNIGTPVQLMSPTAQTPRHGLSMEMCRTNDAISQSPTSDVSSRQPYGHELSFTCNAV